MSWRSNNPVWVCCILDIRYWSLDVRMLGWWMVDGGWWMSFLRQAREAMFAQSSDISRLRIWTAPTVSVQTPRYPQHRYMLHGPHSARNHRTDNFAIRINPSDGFTQAHVRFTLTRSM